MKTIKSISSNLISSIYFLKICPILLVLIIVFSCSGEDSTPEIILESQYTLSVVAGDGGTVSSGGGTFKQGTETTITATPNEDYVFSSWSNGSTTNPYTITLNANLALTANFEKRKYPLTIDIEGDGTVTEAIINAGKTTTDYTTGSLIRLTAEPSDEWNFVGWTGTVESTENPIEITVDEAKQITASFEIVQYMLTVTPGEGGGVDTTGGSFDSGSQINITAIPDNDFIFSHWSDDSEENPRTITLNADFDMTAIFQNKFEIENGFYIYVGYIADNGDIIYFGEPSSFVFEYIDNQAITCGTVYDDLASFKIFKDIGYVPGKPDDNLTDVMIARNTVHREYYNVGVRNSWLLKKIDESEIPFKRTHEEIMTMVAGKGFWSDPIYSQIDPLDPKSYVIAFINDAARHGVDLSFVDVNKITVEFRDEGFAGLSHLSCIDDDRVEISYYIGFWNSTSYYDIQNERLTVMYHELGHDILNSGHPPTGDLKQFMNQALGDEGPIVWDDSNPMFSFRRMVDDMFSGVGLNYECQNGAMDYSN